MSRRIIVSLIAAVALAVSALASTAGATITITQAEAGPGYQNLSPFNCGGKTFYLTPHYVTDPNGQMFQVQGSGLPIRLGFGWAAHQESQMRQFFLYSNGSVSISGTDTFADSWTDNPAGTPYVTQQGIAWSQLESTMGTPPGGTQSLPVVVSAYRGVLSLAPGTYILSQTFLFDRPIQDGIGSKSIRDPMTSTCTFTVAA
jgi:hypothetical protein